jgi:hypothetical protein
MDRKEETKIVKAALAAAGINARIDHGKGTAWGWLHINIGKGQQFGEHNHGDREWPRSQPDNCPRCHEVKRMLELTEKITLEVTGRRGEYGGRVNYSCQDEWNQKQKCSVPLEHPNWKVDTEPYGWEVREQDFLKREAERLTLVPKIDPEKQRLEYAESMMA